MFIIAFTRWVSSYYGINFEVWYCYESRCHIKRQGWAEDLDFPINWSIYEFDWVINLSYTVFPRLERPLVHPLNQYAPMKNIFVSYVVTDNNKLPERDVDNDIPH